MTAGEDQAQPLVTHREKTVRAHVRHRLGTFTQLGELLPVVPAFAPGRPTTVDLNTEHQCDFWDGLAHQGS